MNYCKICNTKYDSHEFHNRANLCPECWSLFQWFLNRLSDKPEPIGDWLTPDTTFHELSVESLDFIEWVNEAEVTFGFTISDESLSKIATVGDYLRQIRLSIKQSNNTIDQLQSNKMRDIYLDK